MEGGEIVGEGIVYANELIDVGQFGGVKGEAILMVLANPLRKELRKGGWERGLLIWGIHFFGF